MSGFVSPYHDALSESSAAPDSDSAVCHNSGKAAAAGRRGSAGAPWGEVFRAASDSQPTASNFEAGLGRLRLGRPECLATGLVAGTMPGRCGFYAPVATTIGAASHASEPRPWSASSTGAPAVYAVYAAFARPVGGAYLARIARSSMHSRDCAPTQRGRPRRILSQ